MRTINGGAALSEAEYSIGRHCGVTFAGLKPASLVNLRRGDRHTVARLARCFRRRGFSFVILRETDERQTLYIYHAEKLGRVLFSDAVKEFLHARGYRYSSVSEAIANLKERMAGEFPHEIGVFLGYPLDDVRGFIENPRGGKFSGAWKVYGDEVRAEKAFERFRRCSACICRHMDSGKSLAQIFNVG